MSETVTLLTTSETARRAAVDASTVRRWVEKGLLHPAVTTPGGHYRFDPSDVEELLSPSPSSTSVPAVVPTALAGAASREVA